MLLLLKIALPVLVFVGAVFSAKIIKDNAPEPRRRPQFEQKLAVEASTFKADSYQVRLASRGTARPKFENGLVPEITGTVVGLSPNFVVGGSFEKGETLIELDRRDFEIAVIQAQANVAQASAGLQEEQARSKQAKADWKSLGRKGSPSALTARVPQVAAARAQLALANAQVQKAELDLDRTKVVAPFSGRVLEKAIDVGEFVNRGTTLGRIYATSALEVRLPMAASQLTHLDIPGMNRSGDNKDDGKASEPAKVTFRARVGNKDHEWTGRIVRSEGIDTQTQQLHVVAQIDDVASASGENLRVGQYLSAEIEARRLDNVFVLPRAAVREGGEIVLLDDNGAIQSKKVAVAWTDEEFAAIPIAEADLPAEPVVVTTVLGTVIDGTEVTAAIDGVQPERTRPARGADSSGRPSGENRAGKAPGGAAGNKAPGESTGNAAASATQGASGNRGSGNQGGAGGGQDRRKQFSEWKQIIESGGKLPEADVAQIKDRIASGGRVPPWLRTAVESQ